VEVRPLGGDSFQVRLDAGKPSVGEAKAEIARVQGTEVECQELYRVAVREDGGAVREDDAEPEFLDDEGHALEEGSRTVFSNGIQAAKSADTHLPKWIGVLSVAVVASGDHGLSALLQWPQRFACVLVRALQRYFCCLHQNDRTSNFGLWR
jgi:hypothetical protein